MFDLFLNAPLCSKHIDTYFNQIYVSDKPDRENELVYLLVVSGYSDNVIPLLKYLIYKLAIKFYQYQPNSVWKPYNKKFHIT